MTRIVAFMDVNWRADIFETKLIVTPPHDLNLLQTVFSGIIELKFARNFSRMVTTNTQACCACITDDAIYSVSVVAVNDLR